MLIAVAPETIDVLAGALAAPDRTIRRAVTWADALRHLDEPPHLIVGGIYFDNGRFFDLLKRAKETAATQCAPFIAVRAMTQLTDRLSNAALELAILALGGARYLDYASAAQRGGADMANEAVRRAIDAQIASLSS
ncbi:MAG: hypothetical protein ACM30I_13475 [Gemmatimonas sp.]